MSKRGAISPDKMLEGVDRRNYCKLDADNIQRALEMRRNGSPIADIASHMGIQRNRIEALLSELDADGNPPRRFRRCPGFAPSPPRRFSWDEPCTT